MNQESQGHSMPSKIGAFVIGGECGRGGMATVYQAVNLDTGMKAAVKVLEPELAGDRDAVERIEVEAKLIERLRHPHIAQLLSHGRLPDGRPYLASEFIDGVTLAAIIEQRQGADWGRALKWMINAAEALDAAWNQRIIHRDVKPGNMIIDQHDQLKLLDFGMGKEIDGPPDYARGSVIGTPRYIAPEVGLGQSLDFRADMYGLGASFYHLFVGQSPFDAASPMDIVKKHAYEAPIPPHSLQPNLPHDICDILMHLLQKDPAERYQSYADLISDLREARLALHSRGAGPAIPERYTPAEQGDPSLADPRLAPSGSYGEPRMGDPGFSHAGEGDPTLADPRLAPLLNSRPSPAEYGDPTLADPRLAPIEGGDPSLADPRLGLSSAAHTDEIKQKRRPTFAENPVLAPMGANPDVMSIDIDAPQSPRRTKIWLGVAGALLVAAVVMMVKTEMGGEADGEQQGWAGSFLGKIGLFGASATPEIDAAAVIAENKARMEALMTAISRLNFERDRMPGSLAEVVSGGSATEEMLVDSWGKKFAYSADKKTLGSAGPDRSAGTEDDFEVNVKMKFTKVPTEEAVKKSLAAGEGEN